MDPRIGGLGLQKKRTRVVSNSLNPVWNESWDIELTEPSERLIVFRVLDKDTTTKNDLLGISGLSLALLSLPRQTPVSHELPLFYKGKTHGSISIELTALDFEMNGSLGDDDDHKKEETDVVDDSALTSPAIDLSSWSKLSSSRSLKSILSRKITEKDDAKLNSLFEVELVDDVYDSLGTGDILLHSGNGSFSAVIQLVSGCMWSHVSLLIRDPSDDIKRAYNVPEDTDGSLFVFEAEAKTWDNKQGGGLQLVEFRKWMREYYERDPRDFMALRRLVVEGENRTERIRQLSDELKQFILQSITTRYEQKQIDLMRCIVKRNKKSDTSSFFCSEVVAECFVRMGVLPKNTISSNYSPKDFSSGATSLATVLLQGAKFSTEKRVRFK